MNLISQPLRLEISSQFFQIDRQRLAGVMKSAITVAGMATGILGSIALYHYNKNYWVLSATTVALVNLYLIPKALKHGNVRMIKTTLIVSIAALGCLVSGSILNGSYLSIQTFIQAFKVYSISNTLWSAFIFTGLTGYGIPLGHCILNKAYSMLHHSFWQKRFEYLQQRFHQLPEVGWGFLQSDIGPNFLLLSTLITPGVVQAIFKHFNRAPSTHVTIALTASSPAGSQQLINLLNHIDQIDINLQAAGLTEDERNETINQTGLKENLYSSLMFASNCEEKELTTAVNLLQDYANRLIPRWLAIEDFIALFQGPILPVINTKIESFLNKIAHLDKLKAQYMNLSNLTDKVEQEINENYPNKKEGLSQRLLEVNCQLIELKKETEYIYREKQRWMNIFNAIGVNHFRQMHAFSKIEQLSQVMQDQPKLLDLTNFHQSLSDFRQQPDKQSLPERMQLLFNRLKADDESTTELVQAWEFLGAERCDFKTTDYEEMQQWLNISSLNDLEAKFNEIGLKTENDLYEKNILPRQLPLSKEQIKKNLKKYIEEQLKGQRTFKNRVYPILAQTNSLSLQHISQKITQLIYRLITMGLILVPIFVYPLSAGIGFTVGGIFCIFKRFEFKFTKSVDNLFNLLRNNHHLGGIIYAINSVERNRFFSWNPETRNNFQAFNQAGSLERLRLINFEILKTLFITYSRLSRETIGLGGFIRGTTLGSEVVNLF